MSRTTLVLLFGLALVVPVVLTSVQIYQKQIAPEHLSCETLTSTLEGIDDLSGVPRESILILGDKPLRHWNHPLLTVGKREVVLRSPRGINAQITSECFQRTVAFYHPLVTVMFLSRDEASASRTTLDDLSVLQDRRQYYGVSPYLVLVPPIDIPIDASGDDALESFRRDLEIWAASQPGTLVANLNSAFVNADGKLDPKLFWPDGRTLTTEGYRRMGIALKEFIGSLVTQ